MHSDTYRSASLHVEEVDDEALNDQNHNVYKVELPGQGFESDGVDVLVEDARQTGEHKAEGQALGADIERQDFDGVGDGETGPCETGGCDVLAVEVQMERGRLTSVEEEDHGQHGGSGTRVSSLLVYCAACGPDGEGNEHADAGA